jgi:septum formation protein
MLFELGIPFVSIAADIDETALPAELPADLVQRLARAKAEHVAPDHPDKAVLAADTVVALGEKIFGKPADIADARRMIEELSGKTHQVHTGVCLIRDGKSDVWTCTTDVTFKELTATVIDTYLLAAAVLDKAGAYAIQEHGGDLIESYEGLYSNVVGLPIEHVVERLQDHPMG